MQLQLLLINLKKRKSKNGWVTNNRGFVNKWGFLTPLQNMLCSVAIVCTLLSAGAGGEGVEPPEKFSKSGSLTGSQFLEWSCW